MKTSEIEEKIESKIQYDQNMCPVLRYKDAKALINQALTSQLKEIEGKVESEMLKQGWSEQSASEASGIIKSLIKETKKELK